ncbi:MAG TPA: serine hydrolase domain-containing protein [Fimbriimonadaceae bacterium]|nr:serine hydrolase domain-containing protein [Fimbriimonadaceae bacterium]
MISAGLVALLFSPVSQDSVQQIEARVKARLSEALSAQPEIGMTCAFVLPDGRTGSLALGFSDRERKVAMKPDDRMLAGSVGKTFFAALALRLASDGKINLDERVASYLGKFDWFKELPNYSTITVRQLMNHTSGIPEHVAEPKTVEELKANPDKQWAPIDLVKFLRGKKPLFEAGKDWSYGDSNYIVLGLVIEEVTGASAYGQIGRSIIRLLGLSKTVPSNQRALPGLVQGYSGDTPFFSKGPVLKDGKLPFNPAFEWAGGGFLSNSLDLAKWSHALVLGDVLPTEWKKRMQTGVPSKTGQGDEYGLGLMKETLTSGVGFGHEGWFPGYLSQMITFPEHRMSVAIQINTDDMRALKRRTRWYCDQVANAILKRD